MKSKVNIVDNQTVVATQELVTLPKYKVTQKIVRLKAMIAQHESTIEYFKQELEELERGQPPKKKQSKSEANRIFYQNYFNSRSKK